ncbi:MAG: hypothetical protein WDO15_19925 [Bacteroidota bacterium]
MLAYEQSNTMIGSFLGKYISGKDVAAAFKMPKEKLPAKDGMGYTEPILGNFSPASLIMISVIAVLATFAIGTIFNNSAAEQSLFQDTYSQTQLHDSVKMISTPSFELAETKALAVQITAPLENDWFYAEYSLINDATGEEQEFSGEVSYYSGRDEDGFWSEGSRTTDMFLSRVPAGKYHLDIYPEFGNTSKYFHIAVYPRCEILGKRLAHCHRIVFVSQDCISLTGT